MCRLAALLVPPLLASWLMAQDVPVPPVPLPENVPLPAVDTITPVPAPEILPGQQVEMAAMPENLKIKVLSGGFTGNFNDGTWNTGAVKITGDNGLEIFADRSTVDTKAKKVTLEGNVSVYQGNFFQRGEHAVYYYETKQLDASGLRVSVDPLLLESGKFTYEQDGNHQVLVGEDAGVTTHDVEDPNFWVRASKIKVYPGDRVTFKNLRLYAGDTPVFWLPYLSQPLDAELGYHFIPGARSNWGPYLLNSYGIMLGGKKNPETGENEDAWLLSKWHFDIRSRRGIGTGVDLSAKDSPYAENITGLSLYYLNDLNPDISRNGVERGFVGEDRYRLSLKQRFPIELADSAEWYADSNLTLLSDRYYLEDFEPETYNKDPAPDNTVGLYRRDDFTLLSFLARVRANDFYRADTRLPEVSYDQAKRPLFGLPILHEGTTSAGLIGAQTADFTRKSIIEPLLALPPGDPNEARLMSQLRGYEQELAQRIRALPPGSDEADALTAQLLDTDFTRVHTYHQFSYPMLLGGWLSLTPQVGGGYTRYGSVDGPESTIDRAMGFVGTEASLKFSKDLGDIKVPRWGVDGLLHVVQPYLNWSVLAADDVDSSSPRVDRLTFTTRPRPLSPIRYTAIDDLDSWNTVRVGTRNRLLTKRDGQTHEWLYMDTYMEAFVDKSESGRDVSNLYNDIRWAPLPWMSLDMESQVPVINGGSGFSEFATRLRFLPTQDFEFSLGYRLLDNHPVLVDSNRFDLRTYLRLGEEWGVGTQHVLELDDRTLELQQYTVHRDLGNWVAGVGLTRRDNRLNDEYGLVFSLTLKDFPAVSLPFSLDAQ